MVTKPSIDREKDGCIQRLIKYWKNCEATLTVRWIMPSASTRSKPSTTDDGGGKRKATTTRELSRQKADLTEAKERADEAVRQAEISRLHAVALQTQLTDQHAAAATAEKQLAELQATIVATGGTAGGDYRSASSDVDSGMTSSEGLSKTTLPEGMRTNLNNHLTDVFCKNKFINNDTLRAYPVIMADACKAMNMKTNMERSIYEKATVREIKYMMSQKRSYCKKMVMKRYKGEWKCELFGKPFQRKLTVCILHRILCCCRVAEPWATG